MSKSIAVFGAGPGLGRAIAHRYAREGYAVALVARRPELIDQVAKDVSGHAFAADLADIAALPELAARVRAAVGDPEVLYYGAAAGGFGPVLDLTPERVQEFMALAVHAPLTLVREFLPAMLERGTGAILSAQGASAVHGNPHIAGGVALAAQRNYLQALHAAVADRGVYVGGLYIGAAIEHTPFHAQLEAARAAGEYVPDLPSVDPADLAELLWTMHHTTREPDRTYP